MSSSSSPWWSDDLDFFRDFFLGFSTSGFIRLISTLAEKMKRLRMGECQLLLLFKVFLCLVVNKMKILRSKLNARSLPYPRTKPHQNLNYHDQFLSYLMFQCLHSQPVRRNYNDLITAHLLSFRKVCCSESSAEFLLYTVH